MGSFLNPAFLKKLCGAIGDLARVDVYAVYYGDGVSLLPGRDRFLALNSREREVASLHTGTLSQIGKSEVDLVRDYDRLGYNVSFALTSDGDLALDLQDRRRGAYVDAAEWLPPHPDSSPPTRVVFRLGPDSDVRAEVVPAPKEARW